MRLNEQTKGDLLKLNESTDKKIEALKVELNHNIAIAGNTALKAIEQNEETKVLVTNNANEEQNKLSNFLKEFDTRASQFQNEIGALGEDNKKLFDMIQSVAGTALTSKDIKDMATLTNIDELNSKILEYYSKLETTRNTILSITKDKL